MTGVHEHDDDPRNDDILVYVNSELLPRDRATVSVFDGGFVFGDGVWEGLRVYDGHPAFLDAHLNRLYEGAAALALNVGMDAEALTDEIYRTLDANGMGPAAAGASPEPEPSGHDGQGGRGGPGVHLRLMVTRGVKHTLYQDPRLAIGPATIVIVPEFKSPTGSVLATGVRLFTVHVRRPGPDILDPKLNVHSKLNDITAGLQAYTAGADEALMLDPHGFVATCNSTHFFVVRDGTVITSRGDYCLGGITRGNVLKVCEQAGIPAYQKNFSLTEVYSADEAFVTGTFGGVVPVAEVDGRTIGDGRPGPMVHRLRERYAGLVRADVRRRAEIRQEGRQDAGG